MLLPDEQDDDESTTSEFEEGDRIFVAAMEPLTEEIRVTLLSPKG